MKVQQVNEKICSNCKTPKPPDEFYNNRCKKDGKACVCKECSKEQTRKHLAKKGKYKGTSKIWTDAEEDYLRNNYASGKIEDMLAFLPNSTWQTIKQKAINLGLGGTRKAFLLEQFKSRPKKKRIYKYVPKPKKLRVLIVPAVKKKKVEYHKELPRFVEKKYVTRRIDQSLLLPFRLDKKTTLYLPVSMSDARRGEIIAKYHSRKTA
jgi:hypothetical protein